MLPPLPDWVISFLQDVQAMRDSQNAFFKNKNDYNLKKAKHKEAIVDTRLARAKANGFIQPAPDTPLPQQGQMPL